LLPQGRVLLVSDHLRVVVLRLGATFAARGALVPLLRAARRHAGGSLLPPAGCHRSSGRSGAAFASKGLRPGGRGRSGAMPEGACSPQHGAKGRLVVLVRPSWPEGFGPTDVSGQVSGRWRLAFARSAPTAVLSYRCGLRVQRASAWRSRAARRHAGGSLLPPARSHRSSRRAGTAFMARGLRPKGRERHGARPEGACSLRSGVTRRQVALVRPSRLKGFGPAALNGPVPGRRELASASPVPPTACCAGAAFMA
jgi:hypothetical protein